MREMRTQDSVKNYMSYKINRCWVRLAKETTPAGFVNPWEIPTGAVEVVAERIGLSAAGFRSAPKLSYLMRTGFVYVFRKLFLVPLA